MPSPAQPGDYILVTPFSEGAGYGRHRQYSRVCTSAMSAVGSAPRRRESSVEEESTRTTPIDV